MADYGRDEGFNRALHRGVNILDPAEPEKDAAMSDHGVVTVNLAAANCISTSESSAQDASASMSSAQNEFFVKVEAFPAAQDAGASMSSAQNKSLVMVEGSTAVSRTRTIGSRA